MAKRGLNVMLISRTEANLARAAKEINSKYPNVEIRWIVANFSSVDIYEDIEKKLKNLDIGVLVNNVGRGCEGIEYFSHTNREFVKDILNVNLISVTVMTHIVLPQMATKNRGLIINNASIAGSVHPFCFVMYGSTKRYMKHFTYGLQLECQRNCPGVIVQDLSPWFVATKMVERKGGRDLFLPTPSEFVAHAIKTIGLPSTHGHIEHEFQAFILRCLPERFAKYLTARFVTKTIHLSWKKSLDKEAERKKTN